MASPSVHTRPDAALQTRRRVFLIWQNPETSKFIRVGSLSALSDGSYRFEYSDEARSEDFEPLIQFPDLNKTYHSPVMPAFFANRLMSTKRPSYHAFLSSLGFSEPGRETPIEILARGGGRRATDTFQLVDDLTPAPDGTMTIRFLGSGVRHIEGAKFRLAALKPEEELQIRHDPHNPKNPEALVLCNFADEPLAYVPDWLLPEVHMLLETVQDVTIIAEKATPEAHPHLRLLCRLEAH